MYRSLYGSSLHQHSFRALPVSYPSSDSYTRESSGKESSALSTYLLLHFPLSLPSNRLTADFCGRCRKHYQVRQSCFQGMTIPSPQEATPCSGAKWGQEENNPQHTSVLIFVIGVPKQQCLSLVSHKAITLMWHFIVHKMFPGIFFLIPLNPHKYYCR